MSEIAASVEDVRTREQAEAWVRQVTFTCRGPKDLEAIPRIVELLEAGQLQEAAALDNASRGMVVQQGAKTVRFPCGENLTDVFCNFPFDGLEHSAVCPKCGTLFTWTAPWFPNFVG